MQLLFDTVVTVASFMLNYKLLFVPVLFGLHVTTNFITVLKNILTANVTKI